MLRQYYMVLKYYKNNLIFNFIDLNENLRNFREQKMNKLIELTYKMICFSAIKCPVVLKMASNGV